jgi:hypothetical protein
VQFVEPVVRNAASTPPFWMLSSTGSVQANLATHAPYERLRTIVESPVYVILTDALDVWGCHSSRWQRGRTIGHGDG